MCPSRVAQADLRYYSRCKHRTNHKHQSDGWLVDRLIDYLTMADCNNPARGQKEGNIRTKNEDETEKNKRTNKQTINK